MERLCDELNVGRGTVIQDTAFDAFAGTDIALLFPFAPSEEASEAEFPLRRTTTIKTLYKREAQ